MQNDYTYLLKAFITQAYVSKIMRWCQPLRCAGIAKDFTAISTMVSAQRVNQLDGQAPFFFCHISFLSFLYLSPKGLPTCAPIYTPSYTLTYTYTYTYTHKSYLRIKRVNLIEQLRHVGASLSAIQKLFRFSPVFFRILEGTVPEQQ